MRRGREWEEVGREGVGVGMGEGVGGGEEEGKGREEEYSLPSRICSSFFLPSPTS